METKLIMITGGLFAFGALLMASSHKLRRSESSKRSTDWTKYAVYLILVGSLLLLAYWSRCLTAAVVGAIAIGGAIELYRNLQKRSAFPLAVSLVLFFAPTLCLGHLLLGNAGVWFSTFAFVFLLVATTDSFSQLWGKLLGNHKLCPQLSPGKTWEGLLGGFVSTAAASCFLGFLMPTAALLQLIGLGLIVAVSATAGDLLFSHAKRKIGIKDFSGILPGHGGILDRFDSLIVAAPVFYWSRLLLLS
jgi:phosphatidate cytidylyltransferase